MKIVQYALQALRSIYRSGHDYKKAGVFLAGIVPDHQVQQSLFEPSSDDSLLMKTMDRLNARFGSGKVQVASAGTKKPWKLKREMLSPLYTTSLKDIIQVIIG